MRTFALQQSVTFMKALPRPGKPVP